MIWSLSLIAPGKLYTAVLDTCVLAPMPLCDTLLRFAEEPALYIPKWSADILRELRSTLLRMGYSPSQADRRIAAMESAFLQARVEGYGRLVSRMTNHPKDRHVLAAAVRCRADAVITHNVRDFRPQAARPYGVDIVTPDDFLLRQFRLNALLVRRKLAGQAAATNLPFETLLDKLQRPVPAFVTSLRQP